MRWLYNNFTCAGGRAWVEEAGRCGERVGSYPSFARPTQLLAAHELRLALRRQPLEAEIENGALHIAKSTPRGVVLVALVQLVHRPNLADKAEPRPPALLLFTERRVSPKPYPQKGGLCRK